MSEFRHAPSKCGLPFGSPLGRNRFATDSPLEESGFESSVPPLRKGLPCVAEGGSRTTGWIPIKLRSFRETAMATGARSRGHSVHGGTEISNLVCSSRESANLWFLGNRLACGVPNALDDLRVEMQFERAEVTNSARRGFE
jgi:hypothetical protein